MAEDSAEAASEECKPDEAWAAGQSVSVAAPSISPGAALLLAMALAIGSAGSVSETTTDFVGPCSLAASIPASIPATVRAGVGFGRRMGGVGPTFATATATTTATE
jgi:hypothetical protein